MENELLNAVLPLLPRAEDGGGFHAPTLDEFFPPAILFEGTPFEINRIIMVRLIAVALLILLLWIGTRRMRVVPGRGQSVVELLFGFVRTNIGEEILGRKDGRRFLPLLTTIFFLVLVTNITGVIPLLNIAGSSIIGLPLVLALVAYVTFIYAGIKDRGGAFFKTALFPPGVPKPLYLLLTPIELLSTFILRPISLMLRLLMNMVVGHLLLVLCFAATDFFLFNASVDGGLRLFSVGTFAFGIFFTLFEILVAVLQAYIFTLLTAVYIQLAVAEEH